MEEGGATLDALSSATLKRWMEQLTDEYLANKLSTITEGSETRVSLIEEYSHLDSIDYSALFMIPHAPYECSVQTRINQMIPSSYCFCYDFMHSGDNPPYYAIWLSKRFSGSALCCPFM